MRHESSLRKSRFCMAKKHELDPLNVSQNTTRDCGHELTGRKVSDLQNFMFSDGLWGLLQKP